jgi:2-dehydropantoate 2-reductase
LQPHLTDDSLVVSVQNGLNPHLIARRIGPKRTIACMVHMVCALLEPGRVCRYAEGEFYVGEYDGSVSERVRQLAARMSPAVPTRAVDNVWGYLWCKLIHVAQNVAVGLVDLPAGEVRQPEWVRRLLLAVELEVVDAAVASGVRLEAYERIDPQVLLAVRSLETLARALDMLPRDSAKTYNGLQRELSRGVKTEVDEVSGEIARVGQSYGLRMPLTTRLVQLVHQAEAGRPRDWSLLRELQPLAEDLLAERLAPTGSGSTRS